MSGPARIKGTKLSLTIGSTEIHCEATSVLMDLEDASSDVTTFCDAEQGGAQQHFLTISAAQSTQSDSFWRYLWANTGESAAFVYRPHGNVLATADQPHFTGTLTIGKKPVLGGDAGKTKEFVFTTRLDIDGEPVLDDGTDAKPAITSVSDTTPAVNSVLGVYGTRFTGTTGVTVDGLAAQFTFVNDGILAVAIPGAAAGAANLIVTNADGASAAFALTV